MSNVGRSAESPAEAARSFGAAVLPEPCDRDSAFLVFLFVTVGIPAQSEYLLRRFYCAHAGVGSRRWHGRQRFYRRVGYRRVVGYQECVALVSNRREDNIDSGQRRPSRRNVRLLPLHVHLCAAQLIVDFCSICVNLSPTQASGDRCSDHVSPRKFAVYEPFCLGLAVISFVLIELNSG